MSVMLVQQIETAERIRLNYMSNAFELIGGATLPESEQVVFSRIRDNAFSAADAHVAFNIVRRRRREILAEAEHGATRHGDDLTAQSRWTEAVKSAADLALHQAESFMADLELKRLNPTVDAD